MWTGFILFEAIDYKLLALVNSLRTPMLDLFFMGATWLGSLWLLVPFCASLILLSRGRLRSIAWQISLSLLSAALMVFVLKNVFVRARPALFPSPINIPADASFPSGHAAQVMAVVLAVWLLLPARWRLSLGAPLFGLVLCVGVSRIYLQVHWPGDVLAGWLIGALAAVLVNVLAKQRALI